VREKMTQKVVVIGLDGVPYTSLLKKLVEEGTLENLASILGTGYFGKMEVCIPEISSVSWTSFMTGTQSGKHGVYGFIDLIPGTYKMCFPNFLSIKEKTLFDELGATGRRSVVINLPSTYPAREIPGVLVSGFVAVDLKKAVHPLSLFHELHNLGYSIDVDTQRGRHDHDFLLQDLERTLHKRKEVAEILWDRENWDLFVLTVTGTDRINHFMWDAWSNSNHPKHSDFIAYYQKVDRFVGSFYQKFMELDGSRDGKNHFLMLSDHGFTDIHKEVYLNRWLQENNFLFFDRDPPQSWEDISTKSHAFALDPSRIYIHDKERYPRGSVAKQDVAKVKEEIRKGLQDLTDENGAPVLRKVLDREEVFSGPFVAQGPDLVLLSKYGFDLKGRITSESVFGHSGLRGMHTQDDAFFFSNRGRKAQNIFQVKSVIINSF
jgi:predicted AlkP superfamily phosphohydrolase/phosphomutase